MAYILGYTFADGSLYKNTHGYYYLEYTSTDAELIEKVRKLLGSSHKISFRLREKDNPNYKNCYRIQIGARLIVEDLEKLGVIQNKSLVAKFPEVPRAYIGDFVRGYFDGDGGVNLKQYWRKSRNNWNWVFTTQFTSGSKDFLDGLRKSLKGRVVGGQIRQKHQRGGFDFILSRHDSLALFKLMYDNAPVDMLLKRKYNIFLKAFEVLKYNIAGVA